MGNLLEIGARTPERLTARLLPCFITRRADSCPSPGFLHHAWDRSEGMGRMLYVFLCAGVLLSGFLDDRPSFAAQEPAVIGGDKAVRFEQSTGFFHVAALCRTLTVSTEQIPAPNLPPEITEPAVCWYVKTVVTRGSGQASHEADGKLVISAHHVRFIPRSMQYEDLFVDLPPDQVQVDHHPGQPSALLRSSGLSLSFRFSDLCPACMPGTVNPPALVPALLDREFTLLYAGIRQFDSGWKQIDGLIEPRQAESQMPVQPARGAAAPELPPAAPESPPVTAATSCAPAVSDSVPAPPATPPPVPAVVAEAPSVASATSAEPLAAAAPAPALDRPRPGGQPALLGGAQALRFEQSPRVLPLHRVLQNPERIHAAVAAEQAPSRQHGVRPLLVCNWVNQPRKQRVARSGRKAGDFPPPRAF